MIPLRRIIMLGMLAAGTTAAAQTTDSLFVRVAGDSISIRDIRAVENCASRFTSALTISHDTLTWVQTDTVGPIARCICHYDMEVSIAGLAPGSYIAWVYRDRRKAYHYSSDTMLFIGTIVFTVTTPAGTPEVRAFYQSDCNPTSVTEEAVTLVPAEMSLCNYPNPFNPVTTIGFRVAGGESRSGVGGGQTGSGMGGAGSRWVRLAVYDMLGREVGVLVNEWKRPGMYTVQFDGSQLSSGVYVCRLQTEPSGEGVSGPFSEHGAQRILTTMMVLAK
jgi:hypothetical protein